MRLFVSIDLDGLEADVAAAQEPFADLPGVDPVDPGSAHVTLKFLGEVDAADLSALETAIGEAVEDAGTGPFEASIEGYGVFPSLGYISVVWAGVETGAAEMTRLHEAVEARTVAMGFDPESHEFTPHVTLARLRDARSKAEVQEIVTKADVTVGRHPVSAVRLTESVLTNDGPVYETVTAFPL